MLFAHPEVHQAAVVGIPDDVWGQRIAVVVVLRAGGGQPSADDLREWCRSQLRTSKTPEMIEFRADLPQTETGKLLRRHVLADLPAPNQVESTPARLLIRRQAVE